MDMTRRHALRWMATATAAVAAAPALRLTPQAYGEAPATEPEVFTGFTLPDLPYAYDAFEPAIDAKTMMIHHQRHHQAYINTLNATLRDHPAYQTWSLENLLSRFDELPETMKTGVRNHGGGHHNHMLFWTNLSPDGGEPEGDLRAAIDRDFGSVKALLEQLRAAGLGVFGSGWAWLVINPQGTLAVTATPNQDSPLMEGMIPLLGIDVWEHAYYLNYQNRRAAYLDAVLGIIDWQTVSVRMIEAASASALR